MADTNPIRQFEVHPVLPMEVNGIDLSFTNSSYFMFLAVAGVTLLMALATTILGALDIRRLFRHLRGDGDSPDDSTGSGH